MRPTSPPDLATPLLLVSALCITACSDMPVQSPSLKPAASLTPERLYHVISLAPMVLPAAINSAGQVAGDCGSDGCLWESGRVTYFGGMRVFFGMYAQDNDVMNDAGQVVGICEGPSTSHACMWDRGHGLTDLGAGDWSFPRAINGTGDIVGGMSLNGYQGFVWRNGVLTGLNFQPQGINSRGQVVGATILWDHGVITDLGSLGGPYTDAVKVNAAGQVAGLSVITSDPYQWHAFLWDHGAMMDLGRGGSVLEDMYRPIQVNARGQVLSNDFSVEGVPGAWLWERGTRTFLSSLKGPRTYQATALSATGFVTGWYRDPPCEDASHSGCGGLQQPFVSDGRTVIDLPTLNSRGSAWGLAVNSAGQVAGYDWQFGGVLWTR